MSDDARQIDFDGAPIPVLRELLQHESPGMRGDAACALGDRVRAREVTGLDPAVCEEIAALLGDPEPQVRLEAAIALAEIRDRRATDVLISATHARTWRLDAVRALGTLGDPQAIRPLTRLMRRFLMPWADRLQAAAALCALGDPDGQRYLLERLSTRRKPERAAAIHFLGESHHPRALELLCALLADPDDPMRDVAARALGQLSDARAREPLERARGGADPEFDEDIDRALEMLARSTAS